MNSFNYDKIINEIDVFCAEISRLKSDGVFVIEFPMRFSSKNEIFEFVKTEFPLDPLIKGGKSWDALADSIGGGLEKFRTNGVVVVMKYDTNNKCQSTSSMIEFIDILFQIRNEQILDDMKIYLYLPNGLVE
ncbi:hypothetical protein [Comamonas squillarum]|uniref:Barstar (barnase inhibitor) domain-containing protein n=1 Tax=Comamonas squillarum TaxID=2977320 RepID=A0ABY5ZUA6_9BURK|nr:hypothetical protein [Comamonas sp. PR12]UXC17254.1 hypothetical protein N4T19_16285 [Comamonas sp. PR12]